MQIIIMISFYMAMLDEPEEKARFEDAYKKYRGKMLAMSYKIIGNYHDAEEAVSNAFFTIAKNFGKVSRRSPQERAAYYCVVTKNCSYDILRERGRRNEVPLDEDIGIEDGSADVSDEVLGSINYERVLDAIRSLPEIYAQALYLQNVTGLSLKEMSEVLNESEATVRKRLERARAKLRRILDDQGITVD